MNPKVISSPLPDLLIRLWRHLPSRRQYQFVLLVVLMLVSALAEVISLGAVLPFIGILVEPDRVFNHPFVGDISKTWGINSADQLVLPLTVVFTVLALMAGTIRIFLLWISNRLAFATGSDLGLNVYRRTLYQPYSVHVARNSSEVLSGITHKVDEVVFGVLVPLLTIFSSIVLLVMITFALIAIDPIVASVAAVSFGTCYIFITWISRQRLRHNSELIAVEHTQVVKAIQEGLGGIRNVLLDNTQQFYSDIFRKADQPLRRAQSNNTFIGLCPRYIMEILGMALIAALAYVLSTQIGGLAKALPVLGALALGAQRLLPALQQIYYSWAMIAGSHASLEDTIALLDQPLSAEKHQRAKTTLPFQNSIHFDSVHFQYTTDGPWVLNGITLTIPKGARVGFVGSTGSGKSTTIDLLMGLLIPTKGKLLVDGQTINGNSVSSWQQSITHVPQTIYLADASLAENIAFGIPYNMIDFDRVQQVARQAQIADFIESRSEGYNSFVGERGIFLSGGQRQRIGIARALYKKASVLVFDEATSALDNATEQSVIKAIEGLSSELTILFIAHRLTTIKNCNIIVELKHGRVVSQGTYEELLDQSPSFREMATV